MAQAFFGGIHPNDHKAATNKKPIEILPPPAHVVIPMSLHIGAPCKPCVAVGDYVTVGQQVGEAAAFVSAPVHASISGKVVAVEPRIHFSGVPVMSVVIENDFSDTPCPDLRPPANPDSLPAEQITDLVKNAGIVGMGGATFPTHVKIASGIGKVDTVIVNACECEPYITSDHRTLLEYPDEVLGGVKVLARLFGVDKVHIAIEANKQNAAEMLRLKIEEEKAPAEVNILHTRYPQGAEKQLCQSITGRQVPPGGETQHRDFPRIDMPRPAVLPDAAHRLRQLPQGSEAPRPFAAGVLHEEGLIPHGQKFQGGGILLPGGAPTVGPAGADNHGGAGFVGGERVIILLQIALDLGVQGLEGDDLHYGCLPI